VGLLFSLLRAGCALVSGRFSLASGSGPGPASARSAWRMPCVTLHTDGSRRFVAPALAQQGGMAVSRLDGRGISLRPALAFLRPRISRTRFLGSAWRSGHYWPALAWRGSDASCHGRLSLRMLVSVTCGDLNPTCLLSFLSSLVSGGLIAGRRFRPCPHLIASHGLFVSRTGLSIS
jgi:hypothetical protein